VKEQRDQLAKILAVRQTKRAAVRLELASLAAEARRTEIEAQQAAARAEAIARAGLQRIQSGRADLLSGAFKVDAVHELRSTVAIAQADTTRADLVVQEAAAVADEIERKRQTVARHLLAEDMRCEQLQKRLKELKALILNKRDEREAEDFASPLTSEPQHAAKSASGFPAGPAA
jgi:hypothetical protein